MAIWDLRGDSGQHPDLGDIAQSGDLGIIGDLAKYAHVSQDRQIGPKYAYIRLYRAYIGL